MFTPTIATIFDSGWWHKFKKKNGGPPGELSSPHHAGRVFEDRCTILMMRARSEKSGDSPAAESKDLTIGTLTSKRVFLRGGGGKCQSKTYKRKGVRAMDYIKAETRKRFRSGEEDLGVGDLGRRKRKGSVSGKQNGVQYAGLHEWGFPHKLSVLLIDREID